MIQSRRIRAQAAESKCNVCQEPKSSAYRCPNCGAKPEVASQRLGMVKTAQAFYPSHQFDSSMLRPSKCEQQAADSPRFMLSDRQQHMVDIVMNNTKAPDASAQSFPAGYSPLIDLILRPQAPAEINLASETKQLLFRAFDRGDITNSSAVIELGQDFPEHGLNHLKAQGLISGMGRQVSLTDRGRKALVKMMLDSTGSMDRLASQMKKLVSLASHDYQTKLKAEDFDIERGEDGSWIVKSKG